MYICHLHADGCPEDIYVFNDEFNVFIVWEEAEISDMVFEECPCGNLNATVYGSRTLSRICGGTYTFGAEWEPVQDGCDFSANTFQLCNVTTVCV